MSQSKAVPAEIYGLYCPKTGVLRYIGKAVNSENRLKSHIRDSRRRDCPVHRWIRKLANDGLVPRVGVLVRSADWRSDEVAQIRKARAEGVRLLNVAEGGDEPFCPLSVRAANARAVARVTHDDPLRKEIWRLKHSIGLLLKAGHVRESTKEKLRYAAARRPDLFGLWASI